MHKQIAEGTIIKFSINVRNVPPERIEHTYYQCKVGDFKIHDSDNDYTYKLNGMHFVCLGSTFFVHYKGTIAGLEVLDEPHEIVTEIPNNLKD